MARSSKVSQRVAHTQVSLIPSPVNSDYVLQLSGIAHSLRRPVLLDIQ